MPVKNLKEYLDKNKIKYVSIVHSPAFTAQETAQSAHIPGRGMAKTVMVKIDGKMAMAVLPATGHVDLELLEAAASAKKTELASEREFMDLFPGCEAGAMPPFGNLYDMEVYVEEDLKRNEQIAFNAGSHTELIKLSYADFEQLVKPKIIRLATDYA